LLHLYLIINTCYGNCYIELYAKGADFPANSKEFLDLQMN